MKTLRSLPKTPLRLRRPIRKTEALFRAGQVLRALNRAREAEQAFRACIARDPDGKGYSMDARMELFRLFGMEDRRDAFLALIWDTYDRVAEPDRLPLL